MGPKSGYSPLLTLGSSGFSPASLRGLRLWLDAQDAGTISQDGSGITSAWLDKSGYGNNALQGTTNSKPKYTASAINSRPALEGRHDGSNSSVMQVADAASLNCTTFESFVVCQRVTDLGASSQLFGKYTTSGNQREWRVYMATGSPAGIGGGVSNDGTAVVGSFNSSPGVATGTPCIISYLCDGTNADLYLDGTRIDTDPATTVFNGTGTIDLWGRESVGSDPFAGYIGEAIYFNNVLSSGNRALMFAYLKAKWGIA